MVVSKRGLPQSDISFLHRGTAREVALSTEGQGICGRFLNILDRGLSTSDRLHYWEAAVRIIKDHPLTGIGLNTYAKVIKEYSPRYPNYAHNSYLQVAAELGLPGLAVVLWVLAGPLIFALRKIRTITDPLWSGILGAMAAGYIALLAESALDTTFYSVQLSMMVWIMMALLVAIPRACEAK
jgi:putative inorganic carbon (HCO3(-)) transporter